MLLNCRTIFANSQRFVYQTVPGSKAPGGPEAQETQKPPETREARTMPEAINLCKEAVRIAQQKINQVEEFYSKEHAKTYGIKMTAEVRSALQAFRQKVQELIDYTGKLVDQSKWRKRLSEAQEQKIEAYLAAIEQVFSANVQKKHGEYVESQQKHDTMAGTLVRAEEADLGALSLPRKLTPPEEKNAPEKKTGREENLQPKTETAPEARKPKESKEHNWRKDMNSLIERVLLMAQQPTLQTVLPPKDEQTAVKFYLDPGASLPFNYEIGGQQRKIILERDNTGYYFRIRGLPPEYAMKAPHPFIAIWDTKKNPVWLTMTREDLAYAKAQKREKIAGEETARTAVETRKYKKLAGIADNLMSAKILPDGQQNELFKKFLGEIRAYAAANGIDEWTSDGSKSLDGYRVRISEGRVFMEQKVREAKGGRAERYRVASSWPIEAKPEGRSRTA
jgi:hypothetical protein